MLIPSASRAREPEPALFSKFLLSSCPLERGPRGRSKSAGRGPGDAQAVTPGGRRAGAGRCGTGSRPLSDCVGLPRTPSGSPASAPARASRVLGPSRTGVRVRLVVEAASASSPRQLRVELPLWRRRGPYELRDSAILAVQCPGHCTTVQGHRPAGEPAAVVTQEKPVNY